MFETEHLPYALAIGIDYDTFWRLNPRKVKAYVEAHKIKLKEQDRMNWFMGGYVLNAIGVAIGSAFSKGTEKPEYMIKPFFEQKVTEESGLSKEEQLEQVKALFASLEIMSTNYKLEHQKASEEK